MMTNTERCTRNKALCDAIAVTLGIATIKDTADGAMQKSEYDKNHSGAVDNAEILDNHSEEVINGK